MNDKINKTKHCDKEERIRALEDWMLEMGIVVKGIQGSLSSMAGWFKVLAITMITVGIPLIFTVFWFLFKHYVENGGK